MIAILHFHGYYIDIIVISFPFPFYIPSDSQRVTVGCEALEIFQSSCGRGLRAVKDFEPGEVVPRHDAVLMPR